jgi:putative membrane protein
VPLPGIYLTTWPAGIIYLIQLIVFIVSALVLSLPMIRFRIVPKRRMWGRAHAEAMRQFLAQGLHLTKQRTGVLIFASVIERYAEIVADSTINTKVNPDVWAGAIAAMITAIKDGRPADGFVAAVQLCGAELARHFPPGTLNPNELPDKVVEI